MNGKRYLIFGVIFLAIGITLLVTGAASRAMAYGDFVLAFAFFALSLKADKKTDNDKKDKEESDENLKDE